MRDEPLGVRRDVVAVLSQPIEELLTIFGLNDLVVIRTDLACGEDLDARRRHWLRWVPICGGLIKHHATAVGAIALTALLVFPFDGEAWIGLLVKDSKELVGADPEVWNLRHGQDPREVLSRALVGDLNVRLDARPGDSE